MMFIGKLKGEERLSELFLAVLCLTVVLSDMHTCEQLLQLYLSA